MCAPASDASKKMNPLASDKLNELLGALNLKLAQTEDSSSASLFSRSRNERERTSSPPPAEDATQRQTSDRSKLALAGGRPIMPMRHLGPASTMTKKNLARAALWLDLPKKHQAAYHEVLPLFSKQREHWSTFQQYWQWGNRGKSARHEGFVLFFAAMKQDYRDRGETDALEDEDSFEAMARRKWEHEQPKQTASATNSESFASYARAAKSRLASHSFTRPFRLSSDPRKQDKWATLVEYLNYIYWEVEQDAAKMRNAEPRYRRAMEELLQLGGREEPEPVETIKDTPLLQQLEAAKKALQKQCARLDNIRRDAEGYLAYEALLRRGHGRAEWVLEELALIEKGEAEEDNPGVTGSKEDAGGASIKGSNITMANGSINGKLGSSRLLRKRKTRHDEDEEKDKSADDTAEDGEAVIASPLKRSRRRLGTGSFTSSAPAASMAEAIPRSRLRRSQRDQEDSGDGAVTGAQPADAGTAAGSRLTRDREPRTRS